MPKKTGRNPNRLPAETATRMRELLDGLYRAQDENGAATGALLGISGSAVSQILSGRTRQISIETASSIAHAVGKRLHVGITGEEPPEGMRTIGSDRSSVEALASAAREYKLEPWLVQLLARTPLPEDWPSVTPEFVWHLASVWKQWEGRLGSQVFTKRPKKSSSTR